MLLGARERICCVFVKNMRKGKLKKLSSDLILETLRSMFILWWEGDQKVILGSQEGLPPSHDPPSDDHQSLCCCRNEHGAIRVTFMEEQPKIAVGLSTGAVPTVSFQILNQDQGRPMLCSLLTAAAAIK